MRAGELRHRVTIQSKSTTQDSYGAESVTWQDVATVWAAIWPLRAKEYFSAGQIQSDVTHKIRIRYRSGITTNHRIVFGSRVFDIESVINTEERNIMLEILAKEAT